MNKLRVAFLGLFQMYYRSEVLSGYQMREAKAKHNRDSRKLVF